VNGQNGKNSRLTQYSCAEWVKISAADRDQSLALAIESIRQGAQQLALRRIGPQHHIKGYEHADREGDAGKRVRHGPPKVLRVKDAEVKRIEKSDHDIEPCANESLFVQSVGSQRRRQPKERQQHPRKIDQNARKEDRSD